MDGLKVKIKQTALFTDQDKIEIISAVDNFPEKDRQELADIIDEYDAKHAKITQQFKDNMLAELIAIENDADTGDKEKIASATQKIRNGLQTMITGSMSQS